MIDTKQVTKMYCDICLREIRNFRKKDTLRQFRFQERCSGFFKRFGITFFNPWPGWHRIDVCGYCSDVIRLTADGRQLEDVLREVGRDRTLDEIAEGLK